MTEANSLKPTVYHPTYTKLDDLKRAYAEEGSYHSYSAHPPASNSSPPRWWRGSHSQKRMTPRQEWHKNMWDHYRGMKEFIVEASTQDKAKPIRDAASRQDEVERCHNRYWCVSKVTPLITDYRKATSEMKSSMKTGENLRRDALTFVFRNLARHTDGTVCSTKAARYWEIGRDCKSSRRY